MIIIFIKINLLSPLLIAETTTSICIIISAYRYVRQWHEANDILKIKLNPKKALDVL